MATYYADRADVLRALGGNAQQLENVFGRTQWAAVPATTVAVDGVDIDVPDAILAKLDYNLEVSDSRVDAYVLQAYQERPTTVPAHLREATAKLAAYSAITTDGQRPDWVRDELSRAEKYMGQLAAGKLDLGISSSNRPNMRKPAAYFAKTKRNYGSTSGEWC